MEGSIAVSSVSNRTLVLSLSVSVLLALGCIGMRMPKEYRPFFRLDRDTQPVELRKRPLEEQFDIYLAGVAWTHPPRIDLGPEIGEQGPVILPALLARIRREPKEYLKAYLMLIMVGMPCTAEVSDTTNSVLKVMHMEADSMRVQSSKDLAKQILGHAEDRCRPPDHPARPG
jgi:hypothetical protein